MNQDEDATIWIGYADFLMTLVILFFILTAFYATKVIRAPAVVQGVVLGSEDGTAGISDCLVRSGAGDERRQLTNDRGWFEFRFDGLWHAVKIELSVTCLEYAPLDTVAELSPGDTTRIELYLTERTDSTVRVVILPGDALFPINEYILRPEALASIRAVADTFSQHLQEGDLIAVQGHSDNLPFARNAGTDNWTLSGQRAAAAAKALIAAGMPECRIVTMGFGPSRPRSSSPPENRRIEFRILRGADLTGGSGPACAP